MEKGRKSKLDVISYLQKVNKTLAYNSIRSSYSYTAEEKDCFSVIIAEL